MRDDIFGMVLTTTEKPLPKNHLCHILATPNGDDTWNVEIKIGAAPLFEYDEEFNEGKLRIFTVVVGPVEPTDYPSKGIYDAIDRASVEMSFPGEKQAFSITFLSLREMNGPLRSSNFNVKKSNEDELSGYLEAVQELSRDFGVDDSDIINVERDYNEEMMVLPSNHFCHLLRLVPGENPKYNLKLFAGLDHEIYTESMSLPYAFDRNRHIYGLKRAIEKLNETDSMDSSGMDDIQAEFPLFLSFYSPNEIICPTKALPLNEWDEILATLKDIEEPPRQIIVPPLHIGGVDERENVSVT